MSAYEGVGAEFSLRRGRNCALGFTAASKRSACTFTGYVRFPQQTRCGQSPPEARRCQERVSGRPGRTVQEDRIDPPARGAIG
jgi:hypothetical protein